MQLIGRTDSYKVLINYRAQRHVETCLCWKGRDSGDYLLFQRPGPREQDKEILNGNIAPFWQNSAQYVYLTGRWKPFFRTQTFSIARKMTESFKKKSKQRRKELIYVTVIYTQFKYRVKTVKSLGLTKKPLDGHSAVQSQRQMVSLTLVFIPDSFKPSAVQS